jgi:hypothetical protein
LGLSQGPRALDQQRLDGLPWSARARQGTTLTPVAAAVRRRAKTLPGVTVQGLRHGWPMHRLAWRAWLPIWPWPVCPLAGQASLRPKAVVGSMALLLALLGHVPNKVGQDPRVLAKLNPPRSSRELPAPAHH